MTNPRQHQTRGSLAQRSGVNAETIRYYEKIALLPLPERMSNGYRRYGEAHFQRLCFIRRCRELGFSLDDVRGLLSLVDVDAVSCDQVKRIADDHLADIADKIADLRKMQRTLRMLVENCTDDDAPTCPIIDALQAD